MVVTLRMWSIVIHYFSNVGIWASLGKDENVIRGLTRKCVPPVHIFVRNRDAC